MSLRTYPTDHSESGGCEWPVFSHFIGQEPSACGRSGHGKYLRTCWQHRDAMYAQLSADLADARVGDGERIAELLRRWIESAEPSHRDEYDGEGERRARSRTVALGALSRVVSWYGRDQLPPVLAEALSDLVDAHIDARLERKWSA